MDEQDGTGASPNECRGCTKRNRFLLKNELGVLVVAWLDSAGDLSSAAAALLKTPDPVSICLVIRTDERDDSQDYNHT